VKGKCGLKGRGSGNINQTVMRKQVHLFIKFSNGRAVGEKILSQQHMNRIEENEGCKLFILAWTLTVMFALTWPGLFNEAKCKGAMKQMLNVHNGLL